jgi:aerobic carbon-monoxide dehydrogenase medium subunit
LLPRSFEYHSPSTLRDALSLLAEYREDCKILAGGQSLIPMMKLRLVSPAHLVDLGRVKGLEYVRKEPGFVAIGAMTRMADVEKSDLLRKRLTILTDCASHIADPLVRNMGTMGGNVSHADPSNDMPAALIATGAELVAAGPKGRREIPASSFFVDTFTTALAEGEILVEIRVPTGRYVDGAYVKLERQAGDFGVVGVGVSLRLGSDGICRACGVGLSGVGPTAIKASRSEATLVGTRLGAETIAKAAKLAAEDCQPTGDLRGSEKYKREMAEVLTRRAAMLAAKRARGRLN